MRDPFEIVGVIVIGRNEGERLQRCLRSLQGQAKHIVYVDSGSTDDSVAFARSLGVEVLNLDLSKPFSMARGRNTGAFHLLEHVEEVEFLQFVDGDCEVVDGWMMAAHTALTAQPDVAVVCGRRREKFPEHSVYNRLCDIEWNTPVGEASSCGGDALYRASDFQESGGFNETLIAGEEPELCLRIRRNGKRILRLDEEMTLHDANILTFKAWWKRTLRGGYGAMDVFTRLRSTGLSDAEIPFHHLVTRAPRWSVGWLGVTFILALIHPLGLLVGLGLLGVQSLRIARAMRPRATGWRDAMAYGVFTLIGKWPQLIGILQYKRDIRRGKDIVLIEYK
jgi:GT2 family glycosyltransferase